MALQPSATSISTSRASLPSSLNKAPTAATISTQGWATMTSMDPKDLAFPPGLDLLQSLADSFQTKETGTSFITERQTERQLSLTITTGTASGTDCPPNDQPRQYFHGCRLACYIFVAVDFNPGDDGRRITYVYTPSNTEGPDDWEIRNCACSANKSPDKTTETCQASFNCILDMAQEIKEPLPASVTAYVDALVKALHIKPPSVVSATFPTPTHKSPTTGFSAQPTFETIWRWINEGWQWLQWGKWLLLAAPVAVYMKRCGGIKGTLVDLAERHAALRGKMPWRVSRSGQGGSDGEDDGGLAADIEMGPLTPGGLPQVDGEDTDARSV
ncbi:hypothetical protein QFC21_005340 [Naganishia friedmannii]|uniref:Uncharacterized protein n=1 Tax=Naganishia friedmannii TaxID=89922 RepID=A0ACC2V9D9_9TREE|nr:hypothetical protein QFC21_005340 [Naganishia friedmannii]